MKQLTHDEVNFRDEVSLMAVQMIVSNTTKRTKIKTKTENQLADIRRIPLFTIIIIIIMNNLYTGASIQLKNIKIY